MHFRSPLWSLASGLALCLALVPAVALASSHSEAPGTAKDRLADDTDLYAWVANDAKDAVTFVGNWVPLIEPNSGPNFASFDDNAEYYINIDNVGDAKKHIRYQFTFETTRQHENTFLYNTGPVSSLTDPNLNVRQTYTITRFDNGHKSWAVSGLPVAPSFVGPASMPSYQDLAQSAVRNLPDGSKVFVGPRDDPFYVDLAAVFDLLTIRKLPGNDGGGVDGLKGFNVMTVALQVPKTRLTKDGGPVGAHNNVIGIWDTAERPEVRILRRNGNQKNEGDDIQVSRLGMPLVNELVIPLGMKDRFNGSDPRDDAQFLSFVTDPEVPVLLNLLYGINAPQHNRTDLVSVFLTGVPGLNQPENVRPAEMLRLNMAIDPAETPNRLAVLAGDVAGFPNGRRLSDDIVDIVERVAAGVLVDGFNVSPNNVLGDGVDTNDEPFLPYFPYVAPPHNPLDHSHDTQSGALAARVVRDIDVNQLRPIPADVLNGVGADAPQALDSTTPAAAELSFAGQNPGNRSTLRYSLPSAMHVTVRVFDVQGRVVRTLIDQDAAAGSFQTEWNGLGDDGNRAGKGVYFARMIAGGQTVDSKKLVLE